LFFRNGRRVVLKIDSDCVADEIRHEIVKDSYWLTYWYDIFEDGTLV
jgi:hypothetical protein